MQPIKTVRTTFVGNHPRIIPVKFSQSPVCGFSGKDVFKRKNVDGWTTDNDKQPINKSQYLISAYVS